LIQSNPKYKSIYNIINPILFDVSLRDGIQNANVENYPTNVKKELIHKVITQYTNTNFEIGSLTNNRIMPIMGDTLILHDYVTEYLKTPEMKSICKYKKPYVLVPSIQKFNLALKNNIYNLSFITSASNIFQVKNTNKSLKETKIYFKNVFDVIDREPDKFNTKLYISCINKCPFFGKIHNDFIVSEILFYYYNYKFNELCISDTCGELAFDDFKYIIEKCSRYNIPTSIFSLHLHVSPDKIENIERIITYCFALNINKFDVSFIESGGCSVTLKPEDIHNNLTYELFYEILYKYIQECDNV
jgi:isopropylmalate/homocitrate/citramalate synthase